MDVADNQSVPQPEPAAQDVSDSQPSPDAGNGNDGDVKDWKKEAEKWKFFAQKHEAAWKKASRELDELRKAQMSDAERAIAEAEERGRRAALESFARERAQLKLQATAGKAGVSLPGGLMEVLDVGRFISDGFEVDDSAIQEFVSQLSQFKPQPKFSQQVGLGPQGSNGVPGQLTRADLRRMTPREIAQARKEGRLDALLRGEIP